MSDEREIVGCKQVIVMRKDLGMRKGKMIAQGAHASMKVLLDLMIVEEVSSDDLPEGMSIVVRTLPAPSNSPVNKWLDGAFKKICVYVTSEEALEEIYQKACTAGIPCAMVEDRGLTEFNGVPTKTCCAIGPWDDDVIDTITGELDLL